MMVRMSCMQRMVILMKQPRKCKRNEKIFLDKKGLKPENWMVQEESKESIVFVHKSSKKTREYKKPI